MLHHLFFLLVFQAKVHTSYVEINELCSAIKTYKNEFNQLQPINVVWLLSNKNHKIKLKRCLAIADLKIEFHYLLKNEMHGLILQTDIQSSKEFNISINEKIFFLYLDSFTIWEMFSINGIKSRTKLGTIQKNSFIYELNVEKTFLKRRRNFKGIVLNAMTEISAPYVVLDSNLELLPYNNQMYNVTHKVNGIYISILKMLEENLNFTTNFYKREDGAWGIPKIENGEIVLDGMLENLDKNEAELIVASFDVIHQRFNVVDYLQPITDALVGIYIKDEHIYEHFDFESYLSPLRQMSWVSLTIYSAFMSVLVYILLKIIKKKQKNNMVGSPKKINSRPKTKDMAEIQ